MALLVSLVVSLVFIVILVIATLAVEIDRLPDDPGTGACQGMRRAGVIGPRPFEAAAYASQRRKRPDYPV